jgi:sec-independent protein translocase protein TatA
VIFQATRSAAAAQLSGLRPAPDDLLQWGEFSMFEGLFQPIHLLIVLGVVLLIFGPKKLPELGKGLGEAIRGFKKEFNEEAEIPAKPETTTKSSDTCSRRPA